MLQNIYNIIYRSRALILLSALFFSKFIYMLFYFLMVIIFLVLFYFDLILFYFFCTLYDFFANVFAIKYLLILLYFTIVLFVKTLKFDIYCFKNWPVLKNRFLLQIIKKSALEKMQFKIFLNFKSDT